MMHAVPIEQPTIIERRACPRVPLVCFAVIELHGRTQVEIRLKATWAEGKSKQQRRTILRRLRKSLEHTMEVVDCALGLLDR